MTVTIGEQLQKARMERGLTLEIAAHATHIRAHYLQALEEDRRGDLPSAVQGRGFLRLYADYLGLAVQPLLDQWEGRLPPPPPPAPLAPPEEPASPADQPAVELVTDQPAPAEMPDATTVEAPPADSVNWTIEADAEPFYETPAMEPAGEETGTILEDGVIQLPPKVIAPTAADTPPAEWEQVLIELGGQLRRQREALSISLNDVERFTSIRVHYLKALEDGRLANLPSAVQGRGMLNNYAKFLNLDADAMLLRFADALQLRREGIAAASTPRPSRPNARVSEAQTVADAGRMATLRRLLSADLVVGGGLVIVLLVFIIWGIAWISGQTSEKESQPTAPAIVDVLLSSTPGGLIFTPTIEPTLMAGAGELGGVQPTTAVEAPITSTDPLQLTVMVRQRAWMRVIADGREVFSGRVAPGESAYSFTAQDRIEILTGNGAGLQLIFNQQDLGVMGVIGEVAGRIFTVNGVVTPTPALSPTPTQSPPPTFTPTPTQRVITPTVTPFKP